MEKWNDRRAFFRLTVKNVFVDIALVSKQGAEIAGKPAFRGEAKDISSGGLSFSLPRSLHLEQSKPLMAVVEFSMNGSRFSFEASILREERDESGYCYGCKFENVQKKQRSKLATVLLRIDLEERKERIEKLVKKRREQAGR